MYIQYTMDQLCLPMDLEEEILENHLVRVVYAAVNRLSDSIFADAYPGGGRDSCHPKMLTKVIIYAYMQRIYSSRQIAKAVRGNVMFMWLAGRQRPDFRTQCQPVHLCLVQGCYEAKDEVAGESTGLVRHR